LCCFGSALLNLLVNAEGSMCVLHNFSEIYGFDLITGQKKWENTTVWKNSIFTSNMTRSPCGQKIIILRGTPTTVDTYDFMGQRLSCRSYARLPTLRLVQGMLICPKTNHLLVASNHHIGGKRAYRAEPPPTAVDVYNSDGDA
jgi:hypothetical protein